MKMNWSTSCPDWEQRLINRQSIIPPPIFPERAEEALFIFKQLRIVDLPGKPTFDECSEQWVFDFVSAIFGAYEEETGKQLIRRFYLLISKKNTKSTIAAGIMMTALILCWREEEEHLILAPTKEVAGNSFVPAAGMVRADEELSAMFHVQDHLKTITHRETRSSLKVVAADSETVSGKKSGRILVDEHWLFGKKHNAEAMFIEAFGGQVSRNEGWIIFLTTQSDESPAGVFKSEIDYFRDVRDGLKVDNKSLPVLYEFPQSMVDNKEYMSPDNFYVTNPNLGRSVSEEWLVDELDKKKDRKDGTLQQFLAKHLNIEIGLNLRAGRWTGADYWEKNSAGVTLEEIIEKSDVITAGVDGGGSDDLLGLAVLGRDAIDNDLWRVWNKAWVDPIGVDRRKSEASKYRDFEKCGDLTIIEVGKDVLEVCNIILSIDATGLLDRVGIDQHGSIAVQTKLVTMEFDFDRIPGVAQGYKLNQAIIDTERKLMEGKLLHGGQPIMNWCVSNARGEDKGNAKLITKAASGRGKIDPLMALLNAVVLMSYNPEARNKISDPGIYFL